MKIILHRNFEKRYIRLSLKLRKKFKERRNIFLNNEFDPLLNNHPLHGKYKGYRSISISGDFRVIYKTSGKNKAVFVVIGKHSELYS